MGLAVPAWLDVADIPASHQWAWRVPTLLLGMDAGLHASHTRWSSLGSLSIAKVLRGAARLSGVGSLHPPGAGWLLERQMVAAWGPAIHPSGRLFTRHHDDRKVSKKIPCDSWVRSVGLGAAREGGPGGG